jgi:peptidoglycan hydrolase-like protein with peptidoglycan-binding domain
MTAVAQEHDTGTAIAPAAAGRADPVPGPSPDRPGRTRRWVLSSVAGAVAAGGAGVALAPKLRHQPRPAAAPHVNTVRVTRTDLVDRVQVDGTLGYASLYRIVGQGGVVTGLPAVGTTIRRGGPVYRVDDRTVPLIYGGIPMWRTLTSGVSGADVRQLQQNLTALGFPANADGHFARGTAAAVRHWWHAQGHPASSSVTRGDVVVVPEAIRISAIQATLGLPAAGTLLTATGTQRLVRVPLPVDRQQLAAVGGAVTVALPAAISTTGHVTTVGTVAAAAGQGASGAQVGQAAATATIDVDVRLDHPEAAGRLDGAPVTVGFTSAVHRGVLAVPVEALLAIGTDAYAVAVLDGTGARRTVPVALGLFADGRVEVSGAGLAAGDEVEVPAG